MKSEIFWICPRCKWISMASSLLKKEEAYCMRCGLVGLVIFDPTFPENSIEEGNESAKSIEDIMDMILYEVTSEESTSLGACVKIANIIRKYFPNAKSFYDIEEVTK